MGLAVMMTAQSPAMAAEIETSQKETTVVTQEVSQEDSQEEATVAEDVSAAEQETVTEQETVSEQDSVMVQETVLEEDAIEETSIEVVTEETDNEESTSSEAQETKESVEIVTEAESREVENATIEDVETTEENEEVTTEEVLEENDLVAAQSALTEGWHTDSEGNRTYVKEGNLVKEDVIFIDDAYYGFDSNGKMYANTYFSFWDSELRREIWYRAKADGSLYVNEWYKDYGDGYGKKYYYGENGKASTGFTEINGKKYYFEEEGRPYLRTNKVVYENGIAYVCGEDGVLIELLDNQWTLVEGNYYYVQNGEAFTNRIVQINGKYYGFSSNGSMYADTAFHIY